MIKKTSNRLDDIIYQSVEPPVLLGIMLIGFWSAIHRLVYPDGFMNAVDAYNILIVLNITWLGGRLVGNLLELYGGNKYHIRRILPIIKRSILVVV